jgi:hypothetical protein
MNLFNFLDKGVALSGGRQKSSLQLAAEEALSIWKDDLLSLQLFMWSNFDHEDYPHKALRLTTILTLIGMAVVHRDKKDDTPFIRVLRGAISSVENVNSDREATALAVSSACRFASEELPRLPWPSVIHAVTYLRKSNGL